MSLIFCCHPSKISLTFYSKLQSVTGSDLSSHCLMLPVSVMDHDFELRPKSYGKATKANFLLFFFSSPSSSLLLLLLLFIVSTTTGIH